MQTGGSRKRPACSEPESDSCSESDSDSQPEIVMRAEDLTCSISHQLFRNPVAIASGKICDLITSTRNCHRLFKMLLTEQLDWLDQQIKADRIWLNYDLARVAFLEFSKAPVSSPCCLLLGEWMTDSVDVSGRAGVLSAYLQYLTTERAPPAPDIVDLVSRVWKEWSCLRPATPRDINVALSATLLAKEGSVPGLSLRNGNALGVWLRRLADWQTEEWREISIVNQQAMVHFVGDVSLWRDVRAEMSKSQQEVFKVWWENASAYLVDALTSQIDDENAPVRALLCGR
ncbi:hypothetical protein WJX72_011974 [[Myrmecia] bisecta]|uniref:Uncharacterized protein n=1 Tax=[Myrmecia] bisecta TaxID=41462 RepID=A0AAW1RA64_9CHLO